MAARKQVGGWAVTVVAAALALLPAAAPARSWQALVVNDLSTANSVTPIDVATNTAGSAIGVGSLPLGIAIAPDARTAYVVGVGSHQLTPIDLTTSPPTARPAIDLTGPATRSPNFVAIAPDGRKAYVSDPGNDQVVPVDLTTTPPSVGAGIDVGTNPEGIAFTPDGATAYVADNANTGPGPALTPITVATDRPGAPITGLGPHPFAIAITPNGRTAYVTDAGSGTDGNVYPITLASRTVGSPIAVGAGMVGIAISPDGRRAYVSGSAVTPIDLATGTTGTPIPAGTAPYAVAFTPDGRTLYVTDGATGGNTVTPVDTATNTPGPAITVGDTPRGIAITPDQAPVARFSVARGAPGAATSFDGSASTVEFGTIVSYAWDFGDGTPAVITTTPAVTHTYARAGLYTATLTATDSAGTSTTGATFTGQTAGARPSGRAQSSATFAVGRSAVAPPVAGRSVLAKPASGTVLVRRRGSKRFLRLRALAGIPTGSEFDTTRGSVTITVARDRSQTTDAALVAGGRFVATQTRGAAPVATFTLSEKLACRAVAARRKRKRKRKVTVKEKTGRFETKGQYVAASVEGTAWSTSDACGSSTVSVSEGLVRVRDLVLHRTRTLGAGESYTARRR